MVNEKQKVEEGYEEVKVGFYQFKAPGDSLSGRLLTKARTNVKAPGKDITTNVGKYAIRCEDGSEVAFLGGTHLDELMTRVPIGSLVKITYSHEQELESGNKLKIFRVLKKTQD